MGGIHRAMRKTSHRAERYLPPAAQTWLEKPVVTSVQLARLVLKWVHVFSYRPIWIRKVPRCLLHLSAALRY
jgi:hypothetical protein